MVLVIKTISVLGDPHSNCRKFAFEVRHIWNVTLLQIPVSVAAGCEGVNWKMYSVCFLWIPLGFTSVNTSA